MFGSREQKAFLLQVQARLDQHRRVRVDIDVAKVFELVVRRHFQFSVAPNVAHAQQGQGADRYPHLALP